MYRRIYYYYYYYYCYCYIDAYVTKHLPRVSISIIFPFTSTKSFY